MKHLLVALASVAIAGNVVAIAGNVEDALQAGKSGDFKKAHQLLLIEAEKGIADAQYLLCCC